MSLHKIILSCLFGLCGVLSASPVQAADASPISVAVSIKPVHSLVAGIMAGIGEPSLIVKGGRSPHSYNLKPSDARALTRSDVVVWVGPGLEKFLEKSISALSGRARVVTLVEDATDDPHLWLAPGRAATIVDRVLTALVEIDPRHTDLYRSNASALKTRLNTLLANGKHRLAGVSKTPFLVFHDAWGHFASAFNLSVTGAIALNPERPPGAKKIAAIRRLIEKSGVRCLFREPQFESPLLATVLEDHDNIRVFELDPLGSDLPPGPELYFDMMGKNIAAVASCLQ